MSPVQWGEPPAQHYRAHQKWTEEAAALRSRPGRWACIGESGSPDAARNLALRIRRGRTRAFEPGGSFEAAARGTKIWARYVGDDE